MDGHHPPGPSPAPASARTSTSAAGPFTPTGFARRDAFRVRLDRPALVLFSRPGRARPGTGWMRCRVRDLSASGVAVEVVDLVLQPGHRVTVRLAGEWDGRPFALELPGEVVRVAPSPTLVLYGVRFRALRDGQRDELLELVAVVARTRRPPPI